MFDSSAFIYSVTAVVLLLCVAVWRLKLNELCAANGAPAPSNDDDEDLSGLRLGEVCMIPYGGGYMLGQDNIPAANPVYFVPDEADARATVKMLVRSEGKGARKSHWVIGQKHDMWWFALAYYHDNNSVAELTAMLPIFSVDGVDEARDYLAGLRTSGDRRGRPQ